MKHLLAVFALLWATAVNAQQSERFDEFELHYSIVQFEFIKSL